MGDEDKVKKVSLGRETERVEVDDPGRDEADNYMGLVAIVNDSFEQVNTQYKSLWC